MSEPSLDAPPVARRFLAGGADGLRLTLRGALCLVGGGVLLLQVEASLLRLGKADEAAVQPATWACAMLAAVLLAVAAARWLGSRLAVLSGLILLACPQMFAPDQGGLATAACCALTTAVVALFALGNVPGRLPLIDSRWTRAATAAAVGTALFLAGPAGAMLVVLPCALMLISCADSRGLRLITDPVPLAILLMAVAAWVVMTGDSPAQAGPSARAGLDAGLLGLLADWPGPRLSLGPWLGAVLLGTIPWTPLAALAMVAGLRQGHYATPFWRLMGCWLLGPLLLMAAWPESRRETYLGVLIPPIATLAAAALAGLWTGVK